MLYLIFTVRSHLVRRFFRRFMRPMTVEEAENKKALLSKIYFFISLVTFGSVLYQVKQGRLDWVQSEGLVSDDEAKLSPGMFTMFVIINQIIKKIIFIFF